MLNCELSIAGLNKAIEFLKREISKRGINIEKILIDADPLWDTSYIKNDYDERKGLFTFYFKTSIVILGTKNGDDTPSVYNCSCDIKSYATEKDLDVAYSWDEYYHTIPTEDPTNVVIEDLLEDLPSYEHPNVIFSFESTSYKDENGHIHGAYELICNPRNGYERDIYYIGICHKDGKFSVYKNEFINSFVDTGDSIYVGYDIPGPEFDRDEPPYIKTKLTKEDVKKIKEYCEKNKADNISFFKFEEILRENDFLIYRLGNYCCLVNDPEVLQAPVPYLIKEGNFYVLPGNIKNISPISPSCEWNNYFQFGEYSDDNYSINIFGNQPTHSIFYKDDIYLVELEDGTQNLLFVGEKTERNRDGDDSTGPKRKLTFIKPNKKH